MSEQHWRETTETGGTRSGAARASDGRPFKPYVYGGGREPAAVTAARERHRALNAEIERRAAALDTAGPGIDEPGYEWRREQLLEDGGEWPARIPAAELDELDAARDRCQAALAAVPEPRMPDPLPAPPPGRQRRHRPRSAGADGAGT